MINLIIWGIRDGFEDRLFNLNDVPSDFQEIPRDALFRSLSNKVRPSTYFVISRTRNLNVFTIVDTAITEYNRTAQRPGFVAFSYVLESNSFFAESPMNVLKGFVEFYKSRVGDGKSNNFTREEVAQFVSQLKTERRGLGVQDEKCYGYFNSISEVEELFVGATSYATYSELILFPEQSSHSITELFKERGGGFKLVNLGSEKSKEQDKKSRAKLAEQEGSRIYDLYQRGEKSQAYEAYVSSPYRDLLSESLRNVLNQYDREQSEIRRNQFEREETLRIEKEVLFAIQRNDIDGAINLFYSIQHRHHLAPSTARTMDPYLREKNRVENEIKKKKLVEEQIKEKKRKEKKMLLIAFSIGVVLSLGMLSYFLEVPSMLYAGDQIENGTSGDTVKNNVKSNITELKSPNLLSAKDSLLRGDTLYAGRYPNNESLDSSFVYYKNNEWYYSKDRSIQFEPPVSSESITALNKHFGMIEESVDEIEKAPSPSVTVPSNQPKANATDGKSNAQVGRPKKDGDGGKKKRDLSDERKNYYKGIYDDYKLKKEIPQAELSRFNKQYESDMKLYDMGEVKDWRDKLERKTKI
jgi:hypothetical protein